MGCQMIDQGRLQELVDDFGAEEVPELLALFVAETWEALDQLETMISDSPDQARMDQLHFLKGCARNLGANDFAARCEVLEKSNGPFDAQTYQELRAVFAQVAEFLDAGELRKSA